MRSGQARVERQFDLRETSREQVDELQRLLGDGLSEFEIDEPDDPAGEWWIDLDLSGYRTTVSWRSGLGFGIYTAQENAYGQSPDELFWEPQLAARRLLQLSEQWRKARSTRPASLGDIRRLLSKTQVEMANLLHVNQGAVSKLENRHEAKIGTIVEYVKALGGEVRLVVKLDGGEVPIKLGEDVNPALPEGLPICA